MFVGVFTVICYHSGMIDKLKTIFRQNLSPQKHYLLGVSGGADSMFLFHTLRELNYTFDVCTIDHGIRAECADEVQAVKDLCDAHNITFYTKKIEGFTGSENNLEEKLRNKRYAQFSQLYRENRYDALVLGHHGDDQIETVLKRLFEGAFFSSLAGIEEKSLRMGMVIVRPLLTLRKEEIIGWLEEHGYPWFEDYTNNDEAYLRGRMRKKIFPFLRETFGKEFEENLLLFSKRAQKLKDAFDIDVPQSIKGGCCSFYGIPCELNELEAEFFIRKVLKLEGACLSKEQVEALSQAIGKNEFGLHFSREGKEVILDKQGLFIRDLVKLSFELRAGNGLELGWKAFLDGAVGFFFDGDDFTVEPPKSLNDRLPSGKTLAKWYSENKVPVFLRKEMPVVYQNGKLIGEFLTGKMLSECRANWVLTFMPKKNTIGAF